LERLVAFYDYALIARPSWASGVASWFCHDAARGQDFQSAQFLRAAPIFFLHDCSFPL
jgi:hypothetical protein